MLGLALLALIGVPVLFALIWIAFCYALAAFFVVATALKTVSEGLSSLLRRLDDCSAFFCY